MPKYTITDIVKDLHDNKDYYKDFNDDKYYNIRMFKKIVGN